MGKRQVKKEEELDKDTTDLLLACIQEDYLSYCKDKEVHTPWNSLTLDEQIEAASSILDKVQKYPCAACNSTDYYELVVHHWFDSKDIYHSRTICTSCNVRLRYLFPGQGHNLPPWEIQEKAIKDFVKTKERNNQENTERSFREKLLDKVIERKIREGLPQDYKE